MARTIKHRTSGSLADEISEEVSRSITPREETPVDFIHSGCTNLNLALSGKAKEGGWARGRVLNVVGDGSTGKTLLALELAAQCFYNMLGNKSKNFPKVKKVKIVYDNVEGVMDFPVRKMYGRKFQKGVEWTRSRTAEKFGRNVAREIMELKKGEFLLYVIDALDALVSKKSEERFLEAATKDEEEKGAYKGAEKAAYFSQSFFGNLCNLIEDEKTGEKKDATILIVSQVRTKIDVTFGKKQYRTGGKGMDFYTHQVLWLRKIQNLKRKILGEETVYGVNCEARLERSKVSKPFRKAKFDVIFDRGLDDVLTMVRYLYGKPRSFKWGKKKFSHVNDFIYYIEENNLEDQLAKKVEKKFQKIEKLAIEPLKKRKERF